MIKPIVYTVGHSTRTIDEFVELLRAHGVEEVVDIRSIPRSRHNPQFDGATLAVSLRHASIRYKRVSRLDGLRHAKKDSPNLGWRNLSFRGFADHMSSADFARGLEELETIARSRSTAIMCAEAVPWRCHRSLVADALVKDGWTVKDIMSRTKAPRHVLTPFLKMRDGRLVYPAQKTAGPRR